MSYKLNKFYRHWKKIALAYQYIQFRNPRDRRANYPLYLASKYYSPGLKRTRVRRITLKVGAAYSTRVLPTHKKKYMGQRGPAMLHRAPHTQLWNNMTPLSPRYINHWKLAHHMRAYLQAYLHLKYRARTRILSMPDPNTRLKLPLRMPFADTSTALIDLVTAHQNTLMFLQLLLPAWTYPPELDPKPDPLDEYDDE